MQPIKNSILVRVDLSQQDERVIGGMMLNSARRYNDNFRERNPVIGEVVEGNDDIKSGSWIVCNYNYFDEESPLQMTDDLFSVPVDEQIFAIINEDGSLYPVQGNVLVERVTKETKVELPEELRKPYTGRGIVVVDAEEYIKDQFVFWLRMADYEIVYKWKGKELRAIKVHKDEIIGYIKK